MQGTHRHVDTVVRTVRALCRNVDPMWGLQEGEVEKFVERSVRGAALVQVRRVKI